MEEEKKGFVIKDRRLFDETGEPRKGEKGAEREEPREKNASEKTGENTEREEFYFPEANFFNFVLSLSTQAMVHFGDFPDPFSKQVRKNLPAAKHTIDTLGMLKTKTTGNLDQEEQRLLDEVLFELRMRYVKETS